MSPMMSAGVSSANGVIVQEVPRPVPTATQILVKVAAAGMNRADLAAARGGYSAAALGSPVGMEWAGEVVEIGRDVRRFRPGDRVVATGAGGYAEFAVCEEVRTLPLPEGITPVDAAILPLALLTAHNALVTVGGMSEGKSVFVHGASTSVGLAALQIARLFGASTILGSSTTADKRDRLDQFGVDAVIDPTGPGWSAQILEKTGGSGADIVIDMVTGSGLNETIASTAMLGTIVNVGRLGGTQAELNLDLHALRRVKLVGVTFRSRSLAEIGNITDLMQQDLWALVASGEIALPLDRTYALAEAADAHAHMSSNAHFGKIALMP